MIVVYMQCTLIAINKLGLDIPVVETEPIFKQINEIKYLVIK